MLMPISPHSTMVLSENPDRIDSPERGGSVSTARERMYNYERLAEMLAEIDAEDGDDSIFGDELKQLGISEEEGSGIHDMEKEGTVLELQEAQ